MKKIFLSAFVFFSFNLHAQDSAFARTQVDTLTAPYFWGRGYTNDGMKRAADYLAAQLKSFGVQPLDGKNFLQAFSYPVNTFPGKMQVTVNGKRLIPGEDFLVDPSCRGTKSGGQLFQADSTQFVNQQNRVIIQLADKLTWSVAREVAEYSAIQIRKNAVDATPREYKAEIDNSFVSSFKAYNVAGIVKGTLKPDSLVVISAHYDHLGGMGKETYFPGANDNASGIALLLNLARYYAANPLPYSVGFILFAGEEAGLIGSKYFTENPLVPLKSIRFLLNTDLAGTGEEGITVVNATEFPKEFALLQQINKEGSYLAAVNARGKAANSDHYFFTEKGVPAFFFYTLGGIKAYHDVYDKAATLPLNEHEDLFKLTTTFISRLIK